MSSHNPPKELSPHDQLITRPDDKPLPTPLEPASPEARGYPNHPKPAPKYGQGDPRETNPPPDDIGRSA